MLAITGPHYCLLRLAPGGSCSFFSRVSSLVPHPCMVWPSLLWLLLDVLCHSYWAPLTGPVCGLCRAPLIRDPLAHFPALALFLSYRYRHQVLMRTSYLSAHNFTDFVPALFTPLLAYAAIPGVIPQLSSYRLFRLRCTLSNLVPLPCRALVLCLARQCTLPIFSSYRLFFCRSPFKFCHAPIFCGPFASSVFPRWFSCCICFADSIVV